MQRRSFHLPLLLFLLAVVEPIKADPGKEILANARQALVNLHAHAPEVSPLLQRAEAVLVFPDVVKMGFAVAGQYGEGVLLIDNQPTAYYAAGGARFGLQRDVQYKSEVIVFLTEEALDKFRNTRGWEIGVDADVALPTAGDNGSIDIRNLVQPVVGFIFSDAGLVANLSLEGNRVARIARK